MSTFSNLFTSGRDLNYELHGSSATYYTALSGASASVTVIAAEQIGATDDKQTFNIQVRASSVASVAEGDYLILSGDTAELVVVNVIKRPQAADGNWILRCRSRVERT